MKKDALLLMLVAAKGALAIYIISYFFGVSEFLQVKRVSFSLIFSCIAYISLQLLSYYVSKEQKWWDWVYYVGLLCIMISVSFVSESSFSIFNILVKVGSTLLIVPVLIDAWYLTLKLRK